MQIDFGFCVKFYKVSEVDIKVTTKHSAQKNITIDITIGLKKDKNK